MSSTGNNPTIQLYAVDPTTGVLTARGAAQSETGSISAVAMAGRYSQGGVWAGALRLDRNGDSSLGLLSGRAMHVHQVLGIG